MSAGTYHKHPSCRRLILSSLILVAIPWLPPAAADDVLKLQTLEVTGTRIKRVDIEGLSPLVLIDRQDIERSGAASLNELFRDLIYNAAGSIDEMNVQGTAPASAAIDLRGLGVNRTLVLVNGRRFPLFPFAQGGNGQSGSASFVDINLIPLGAIERIEVLKDGASAIYGSDAIAGVVNIILRRDYEGAEVSFDYGLTDDGDGDQGHFTLTGGLTNDRASVTLIFDYLKRDPVWARDRAFSASADGPIDNRSRSGNPGTIVNLRTGELSPDPRCPPRSISGGFCLYDFAPHATLIPEVDRAGLAASGSVRIADGVELFASGTFMSSDSRRDLAPVGISPSLFVGADNPNNILPGEDLLLAYRFLELGPRRDSFATDAYNLVAGLRGPLGGWQWEFGAGTGRVDSTIRGVHGYATLDAVQAAVDAGTLNPFGESPDFDPASVTYVTRREGESTLHLVDFKLSGDVTEMSHGFLAAAFGAEYREEAFSDRPDALTESGAVMGVGALSGAGDRGVFAAYAEFLVPLLSRLELQLAGRYDDYSDFGDTFNPKLGLRWQPRDNLLLRLSGGTGFKAPSLQELYSGEMRLFDTVIDPRSGTPTEVNLVSGGNPNLDAEESESYSLGLVWGVTDGWDLGLDFWRIENNDAVSTPGAQFFVDNETAFPDSVVRDRNGEIVTVNSKFQNVAAQKLWGVDLDTTARWAAANGGDLVLDLGAAYLGSFEQEPVPGAGFDELAGKDGRPRWRGRAMLQWARANYAASLTLHYVGDYRLSQSGASVDAWTPVDAQIDWRPGALPGGTITVGVDNLLDESPPEDPFYVDDPGWPFFNKALHDPRGRFLYAGYKQEFR